MQVFKTAIKTVLRHPMYLIVYAGFLSMMGVFIASGLTFGGTNDSEFSPYETKFAVIDRDGSALSDGLAAYLREQGIEVPIEDSQMALQDAVAKGQSSYILIVPEGFGDAFVEAARTGDELPTLETVYSFYSTEGSLMDQMVNSYLGIAGAYAGLEGSASQGDIVQHAAEAMAESAETDSVEVGGTSSEAQRFVFFLQWGTYTLFASIIVCVGVMMTTLNRTDLRRRNLVSPLPSLSYGLQLAASSLLVMTAVWLWTICLGFTVFHEATSMISGPGLALMVAASFVFATIPLSVGYLLGQLGVGEFASNALGCSRRRYSRWRWWRDGCACRARKPGAMPLRRTPRTGRRTSEGGNRVGRWRGPRPRHRSGRTFLPDCWSLALALRSRFRDAFEAVALARAARLRRVVQTLLHAGKVHVVVAALLLGGKLARADHLAHAGIAHAEQVRRHLRGQHAPLGIDVDR